MKVAGYGYWLDFEASIAGLSSETFGGRVDWRPKAKEVSWMGIAPIVTLDVANQTDMGENPDNYNEWYNWFELGGSDDGYTLTGVYERLGGNGAAAMQTPIGTVHSFNGWTDKFTTIAAAVEEQSAATNEIVSNMQNAAMGVDQINRNVDDIRSSAEMTSHSTQQVLGSAQMLSKQSEMLDMEVRSFLRNIQSA